MRSGPGRAFASRIAWRSEPAPLLAVLVTMSADGANAFTTVVAVAELLVVSGSVPVAVTVAVFVSTPGAVGVTTMLTVTFAPLAIVPRTHVTVVVPLHDPIDAAGGHERDPGRQRVRDGDVAGGIRAAVRDGHRIGQRRADGHRIGGVLPRN